MRHDEFTHHEIMLPVGGGHTLYVIDWGNRDAKTPILFLHGGPGGNVKDRHKQVFDPTVHRVIFFDQRGAGQSTPTGSLERNTIDDLAHDITTIAKHFKIEKFSLHGYSWGSTLALYYAINHPEKVKYLVIGGVFSGSANEIAAMYDAARAFFPDLWDKVLADTPNAHRDAPIEYHLGKALHGTKTEQKQSSYIMNYLESGLMLLDDRSSPEPLDDFDPVPTQIELHYLANHCFMPDDFILNNASSITAPVHIVQGRFDLVCPPDYAYKLSKVIPRATLHFAISNHAAEHEITSLFRLLHASL